MSEPVKLYLILIIHFCTGLHVYTTEIKYSTNFTKPTIIHSPSDVFSTDGVLEFTCQASGYPKPQVVWYDARTGQQVIDRVPSSGATSGIHVNQHYGKLLISSPERGKLYSFYCNASNAVGWVVSKPPVRGGSAYINSQFQQIPVDKTVHEGDRVVMECSPPMGLPEVKVHWLRNKNFLIAQNAAQLVNNFSVINEKNSNTKISADGSLHIDSVGLSSTGKYTCVASNIAGEQISPTAYLLVKPRTRFLETPVDVRVKKGRDVKLKCRVEGNHVVKWKRGPGENPIDSNRAELTESYLLIKNVQVSDAGTYICTAPGGIEADATVTVDTPPAFSVTPDDLTLNEGETAVFHCIATGHPMPAIYWELPDKTPIFPGDQTINGFYNGKLYLTPDGSLEVRDIRQRDSGKYQCTAHSSIDTIHTSATLHVNSLPKKKSDLSRITYSQSSENEARHHMLSKFYWLAPIIGLPPANQTRTVGESVTLNCELGISRDFSESIQPSSDYAEMYDWSVGWQRSTKTGFSEEYVDSSSFSGDRRYTLLPGGSLHIVDVQEEDSGNYTCFAKSDNKPYMDGSLMSFTLQSNWTSYLYIVPPGSEVTNIMGGENPLPPPRNLKAINVTSTTVILVWDPSFPTINPQEFVPEHSINSHQITYWVELYRPDRPTDGWIVVEKNWHAHTVQLGGLQPDTTYYFLIRPRWSHGRIGWASVPLGPILTLKEEVLNQVDVEVSDTESFQSIKNIELSALRLYPLSPKRVRVSWSVTEAPQILSMITGYFIYHREVPIMQCVSRKFNTVYPETPEIVTRNGDAVYCSIKPNAVTDPHSLYRLEIMQKLYEGLKNKQDQDISNITSNPWIITNVRTHYLKDNKYGEIKHAITHQESSLLRDLEAFRCYEIKAKAYATNPIAGNIEGQESNSLTVLTYESFPSSPPEKIFAVWISNTTIELSWDPPPVSSWNGLLMGYIIYVYDENANNHQNFNLSYTERKTLIKGLTGKTIFFVQMAAVTCKGIGVRSVPMQLRPSLRKKGLGVGWGFDLQTGKLLQVMNTNHKDINNNEDVINQPWFTVTIICSLLVWCATVTLITFCCRHQRYKFRKTTGNVLITNNSQCGSGVEGPSNICTSGSNLVTENKICKNPNISQKDHVQMEPLLRSETPITENENSFESVETGKYVGWRHYPSSAQNLNQYKVTANTHDECNLKGSHDLQLDSFNPALISLSISPRASNESNHVGLYATAENVTNAFNSNTNIQSNQMQISHHVFPGSNTLVQLPNGCNSRSSYVSYHSHITPQSQVNVSIPNGYTNFEQSFSPVTLIGPSGLPLIAPVAQIENLKNCNEPILTSSSISGSPLTVAPYATASIIHSTMKMNGTNGKGCASPTFYVPKNGVYDENGQSSSELTYEFDEKITAPTYTFNTINQGSEYPHHNFQVQYLQTQQTPYVNYANAHSQADNGISDENERSPQFSPLGQRDIAEFMHRQEVRNKSSSGTSSSVNNEDDKSYQWKKSETETLSHEFGVELPTTCLSSVSVANSFKQNISKALTTQRQQYQGIHPPRNEMGGTQLFAYENKRMIPPPPESPPPPAPKYYLDGHNRDKSLNYHSSLMENNEHYEITSEFSSSLCPSPHSLFPVQNDKIQLISQFAVTTEKQHEESEQQFKGTTVTNINDNNSQIFQSNNECSTNERSIYYSEFDSSDDEVQNQTVDSIGKGHEEMTINSKGNFSNFKQNFNSSNQQHYAVNTSFCLEKQTVVSRPLLLLNEHTIPNSPQSSFCVSLSPEEHASSTYAQVY